MRASRLLTILMLLQTRGRMSAPELARELEISLRTVYRDIEALSAAGVPVYAERGPAGGYQLLDGYRTRLTGLTPDEADALFLSGVPGPAAELGLGALLATAQLKLLAALPPELRSRTGRIRERFHLDAPTWFHDTEQPAELAAIADAVWNQRRLRIRYRRWAAPREVTRTLDPLGVVLKAGVWYLVAASERQPRTFRISNILALEVLEESFERPAGFDLAAYWQEWSRRFERNLYREEALIRVSPMGLARLPIFLGPVGARAAETAGLPEADGWTRLALPIESVEHAVVELLRLGADVEVLAPTALRARLAETARSLDRIYNGASGQVVEVGGDRHGNSQASRSGGQERRRAARRR